MRAELQHFEANDLEVPLAPYEAFTIARMIEGLAKAAGNTALAERVLVVAEKALAVMRQRANSDYEERPDTAAVPLKR